MRAYQLYFHGENGFTVGRSEFFARNDRHAILIATVMHKVCSDVAATYAVRQGARTIIGRGCSEHTAITWCELALCREEAVVELEERIQQSGWAVARSRRLMAQLDHFRLSQAPSAIDERPPGDAMN